MGEHRHPRRASNLRSIWGQVGRGAALGLLAGALMIGVGIARAAYFLLRGGHLSAISYDDLRLVIYYMGGFGVAGGLLGLLLPRYQGVVATRVLFAVAGMVVMTAIAASDAGGLRAHDRIDWLFLLPLGAIFGLAFGWTWGNRP